MAFNSEREEIHRNRIAIRSPNRRSSSLRFSQHFHQILQALRFSLLSISLLFVCFYAFAFLGFQFLMCFLIFFAEKRGLRRCSWVRPMWWPLWLPNWRSLTRTGPTRARFQCSPSFRPWQILRLSLAVLVRLLWSWDA